MVNRNLFNFLVIKVLGDKMKLVEKDRDNKKFLISEESGQIVFRIGDFEGSKFFVFNLDEIRGMRDTFHEFVKKYDRYLLQTINQEPPQPPPSSQMTQPFSIMDLPGANAVRDNQPILSEEKKEKPKFEFF